MEYFIKGQSSNWEVVLGLEVHAQISSKSKLFSSASTNWGGEPNTQVELVDCGMPGALPVINEYCINQAILTGLSLDAVINKKSVFDRKNYFYPDLPQGYQISQFEFPIIGKGSLSISVDGNEKIIGITRIHLEQDAGKSIHDQEVNNSFIDLNRSGCALMEIVSEPDMRSPTEAAEYVKKLRNILKYVGSCDGNMEKGNLRADVNVSVRKKDDELGTRCEIKNVNSIKYIQQAIEYEANRQVNLIEAGEKVIQETRLFDPDKNETRSMRGKEESHDYRYFPDPDLPPLILDDKIIDDLRSKLPELPDKKKARFTKDFKISSYDAEVLINDKFTSDFFEVIVKGRDSKVVISWITVELFSYLKKINQTLEETSIETKKISSLLDLIISGKISNRQAKEIFEDYLKSEMYANDYIEKKGLVQLSDSSQIEDLIQKVLDENPKMLEQYKQGKDKLFGFFVGQVMKISNGKANPKMVNEILKSKLSN